MQLVYIFAKSSSLSVTHQPLVKLGSPFIILESVDSTNNYARELVAQGLAESGTAIFAQLQTNGKGQRGKQWETAGGANIILSVITDVTWLNTDKNFYLVAVAALACKDFFEKYAPVGTAIKWLNDLYWNDKKAGGILTETTTYHDKRFAIIGIGININQTNFNPELPNPVSLKQITGKEYDEIALAGELCDCLSKWLHLLQKQEFGEILKSYNNCLYKKQQTVYLKKDNIKFSCRIESVNAFGELMVKDCAYDRFGFGEVQWVIQ